MDHENLTGIAGTTTAAEWTLGQRFMLRVAGLPITAVAGLRCPETLRWAEDVLAEEGRLRTRAVELSDALSSAIGGLEDAPTRQALIRLRRQIFNDRVPSDAAGVERLGQPVRDAVAAWIYDRKRLASTVARGAGLLDHELSAARTELRRLATEDRLRAGLLLASPSLDAQLDAYAEGPVGEPDKRTRKVERSLLAYLYRTACKTSPFATFTGVAVGRFGEATGSDGDTRLHVPSTWASVVRLNVVVLTRLLELVLADPERRGDLPVTVTSGWGRDHDRVRYVRRSVRTGDDAATVTYDSTKDQLFFLRRSRVLDRMLAMLEGHPGVSYRQLASWLGQELDASADECEQYLADLTELGILQAPVLAASVHSPDPLRAFQSALRALGLPWSRRLADRLVGPIRCIDQYADADTPARRALLAELRQGLRAAQEALGAGEATLPQTLLYEDVSAGSEQVVCDASEWAELATGPLRALERMLPAFDLSLRHKLTFRGFFLARFGYGGRCDDLLRLVHEFHEDLYDEYQSYASRRPPVEDGELVTDPNWLGLSAVKAADSARALWARRIAELSLDRPGADELEIGETLVSEIASELGATGTGITALTHFLQRAELAPDPLVVHNGAFGGLAFPFSRFTHCFDAADGRSEDGLSAELRRAVRALQPEGVVFAEVTGGFATSNLNLHSRLTDFEIVGPGEVSTAPEHGRIDLADLFIEHDPESDRIVLRSRRLESEVVPVYLGYLVPQALPAIPRTLLLLSPSATVALEPWAGVPDPVPDEGVTRRPRLRIGSLVVSRSTWTARAGELPAGTSGISPADRFLGWQRWRARHGLPEQVFARAFGTQDRAFGAGRVKPQYVDFASYHSLTALEALLTDPDSRVVFTEMLPTADQLHVRSDRGPHVAELAAETFSHALPDRAGEPAVLTTPRRASL